MVDTLDTTTPKIFHLRYGVFLTDYKTRRYVIATIDAENYPDYPDYPIVFLHELFESFEEETDYQLDDYPNSSFAGKHSPGNLFSLFSLYGADALTLEQANEILDLLKAGDSRKAITKFKRYFNSNINSATPYCEQVNEVVLDDMIPDEWYDAWKEMEFIITSTKNTADYWEGDVKERGEIF